MMKLFLISIFLFTHQLQAEEQISVVDKVVYNFEQSEWFPDHWNCESSNIIVIKDGVRSEFKFYLQASLEEDSQKDSSSVLNGKLTVFIKQSGTSDFIEKHIVANLKETLETEFLKSKTLTKVYDFSRLSEVGVQGVLSLSSTTYGPMADHKNCHTQNSCKWGTKKEYAKLLLGGEYSEIGEVFMTCEK